MSIGNTLAITKVEGFTFAIVQHRGDHIFRCILQKRAQLRFVCGQPVFLMSRFRQRMSVSFTNLEKSLKILCAFGPSFDRQEINDLNEQQRLATTRLAHDLDQFSQTRYEAVVADTQQWTTWNVAHASRLDDEHRRPPFGKPPVPIEILLRDNPVFSRPPRHHRRHPRTASRLELSDFDGAIKK